MDDNVKGTIIIDDDEKREYQTIRLIIEFPADDEIMKLVEDFAKEVNASFLRLD